jgi:hypothetical protein
LNVPEVIAEPLKPHYGGPAKKITIEIAEDVGLLVGNGVKLEYALDSQIPPISLDHWNKTVNMSTRIACAYRAKRAQGVRDLLAQVNPEVKGWQAAAWKLERAHDYTTKQGTQVNVQVNTCIGLSDDIAKRARVFVGSGETANERRRLKDSK